MARNSDAFVRLEYSERNARRVMEQDEYDILSTGGGPCFLFFYRTDLGISGITLGYLRSLAREGYIGLQRIPRWAIVR